MNEVKNKTAPQIIPDVEILTVNSKTVVALFAMEYPIKPVSTRGRYYKRIGNSNHLLSVSEVVDMHLQTVNSSWDAYPDSIHSIDDISFDKVQASIDIMKRNQLSITEDPFSFLLKNNLIKENKITNAAYLLFKKNDSIITTIELGRFQNDIIIKDSARTKSDVLSQIDQVLDFVKKHINKEIIITGQAQNTQKWQYPLDAIREIVLNMIIHRDYRSSVDSIVKIYDNKIEFFNPGRLPDSITVEDLLSNSYRSTPRNKQIADFCKDMGLIEKYGSGIRRIFSSFNQENLPEPQFCNISDGFMVTVFCEKTDVKLGDKLGDKQLLILDSIKKDPYISLAQLSKIVGISQTAIENNIDRLKKTGLLKRFGSPKGGHWEVLYKKAP
jgi:ATP-dependent DNA helicase RecG